MIQVALTSRRNHQTITNWFGRWHQQRSNTELMIHRSDILVKLLERRVSNCDELSTQMKTKCEPNTFLTLIFNKYLLDIVWIGNSIHVIMGVAPILYLLSYQCYVVDSDCLLVDLISNHSILGYNSLAVPANAIKQYNFYRF